MVVLEQRYWKKPALLVSRGSRLENEVISPTSGTMWLMVAGVVPSLQKDVSNPMHIASINRRRGL